MRCTPISMHALLYTHLQKLHLYLTISQVTMLLQPEPSTVDVNHDQYFMRGSPSVLEF